MSLTNDLTDETDEDEEIIKPYIASDYTSEPGTIRIDDNGTVWLKIKDD